MSTPTAAVADTPRPASLLLWRLLALLYDFFPALALWMLVGALFTAGYATGHARATTSRRSVRCSGCCGRAAGR